MTKNELAKIKVGDKVWNRNNIKLNGPGVTIPKGNTFEIAQSKVTGELGARFISRALHNPVFFPLEKYHEWFIIPVTY